MACETHVCQFRQKEVFELNTERCVDSQLQNPMQRVRSLNRQTCAYKVWKVGSSEGLELASPSVQWKGFLPCPFERLYVSVIHWASRRGL